MSKRKLNDSSDESSSSKSKRPKILDDEDDDVIIVDYPTPQTSGHKLKRNLSGVPLKSKHKNPSAVHDTQVTCSSSASGDHSLIETLPQEILELIFSYIPLQEVLLNCQLVCHRWNIISSREKFLEWKKFYYKLRSGRVAEVQARVQTILEGGTDEGALLGVVRAVHTTFETTLANLDGCECVRINLTKHPQYQCAIKMLEIQGKQEWSVLQIAPLLVVCSVNVSQVVRIICTLLARPGGFVSPPCTTSDVMELFYFLASLLFQLWIKGSLPLRFHYFLFYAMRVLESSTTSVRCVHPSQIQGPPRSRAQQPRLQGLRQQSILEYMPNATPASRARLTSEQMRIVTHYLEPGDILKVTAFAGAGKTSTLVKLTEENSQKKFLYVAYNTSVKDQAEKLFPSNVTADTLHGLANKAVKFRATFKHKPYPNLNLWHIAKCISHERVEGKLSQRALFIRAKYVLKTVKAFLASDDELLSQKHIPTLKEEDRARLDLKRVESNAVDVWEKMRNPEDKSVKMTHDGYLKLYQLRKPIIDGYDCILIDEAQDLTPAQTSIMMRQSCAKVFVGDDHQQIYSFRGAINAMGSISGPTLHLTQSFRFGAEIAYTASCVLSALKGVDSLKSHTLTGGLQKGGVNGDAYGQEAIIARTNVELFERMVAVCITEQRYQDKKVGFAGGIRKYGFDKLLDIHRLMHSDHSNIKDKFIKRFKNFSKLRARAEDAEDYELLTKIKICQKHPRNLPELVEKIKSKSVKRDILKNADIVFSTAHKAKGMEFETVIIADDFLRSQDFDVAGGDEHVEDPDQNSANLLYVAVTRAKKHLVMSLTLLKVLQRAKEHFIYPSPPTSSSESTNDENVQDLCCKCNQVMPMSKVPMERIPIKLSDGDEMSGGKTCKPCLWKYCPFIVPLVD